MKSYAIGRHRFLAVLAAVSVVGALAVTGAAPAAAGTSMLFSVNDVRVIEGNSGTKLATFTVSRSGSADAFASVKFKTSDPPFIGPGIAMAPDDYTARGLTTLNFYAGQTTKPVSVTIKGDLIVESDEGFFVSLSDPVGASIDDGEGIGNIVNDDSHAAPTFSVNDVRVIEGNSGTKLATFTVTRSGSAAQAASVKYATANGSAVAPGDYVAKGLTGLAFGVGVTTKTVSVSVKGDLAAEANETFNLNLSTAVGATIADAVGVATIANDDSFATPSFSVNDVSASEGDSLTKAMTFTITRSGNLAGSSSVKFATGNGTAIVPGDYAARALTTISFAPGVTTKTVPVSIKGDTLVEPHEYFTLNLSASTGAGITDASGTGTILNDD